MTTDSVWRGRPWLGRFRSLHSVGPFRSAARRGEEGYCTSVLS
jgi:hypothetical protein